MFLKVRESDLDDFEKVPAVEIYERCVIRYFDLDVPEITVGEMHQQIAQFMAELTKAYYESGKMASKAKRRMAELNSELQNRY